MFKKLFQIDLRSLALFRIAMGFLLIWDLIKRSRDLVAHYTDVGVLPLDVLHNLAPSYGKIFFAYQFSGSEAFVVSVFCFTGLVAFCLMIGYRTTLMTVLSWFLLISLHERNYMIVFGGDTLIKMLLFWSMFLPLGARWSIDSLKKETKETVFSAASVGYMLQVCVVYWASVYYKWNDSWLDGSAVSYALNIDQFATPLTLMIQDWYWLHKIFTYSTLAIELVGPMLIFVPFYIGPIRTFMFFLFFFMHISFGAFLTLGLFPYMSIVGWIPFLPTWFWDKIAPSTKAAGRIISGRFENALVSFLLLYVVFINVDGTKPGWSKPVIRKTLRKVTAGLNLRQKWNMFARPLRQDGWYVIVGTLLNGEQVDLMRGGQPLSWEKPELVSAIYPTERWRKYFMNLWWEDNKAHREPLLKHLAYEWDKDHKGLEKLYHVDLYFMLEKTDENLLRKAPKKRFLKRHFTLKEPSQ